MSQRPQWRSAAHLDLGQAGEDLAQRWYEQRGYQVLARNWRGNTGELDLILTNGRQLVFCEVKTRTTDRYGSGFDAVTADKQRRIRKAAMDYLHSLAAEGIRLGPASNSLRFDVASIVGGRIEVMLAAF